MYDLQDHYQSLLGLQLLRGVESVALDLSGRKVEIVVTRLGGVRVRDLVLTDCPSFDF